MTIRKKRSRRGPGERRRPKPGVILTWTPQGVRPGKATGLKTSAPARRRVPGSSVGVDERDTRGVIRALKQGLPISAFEGLQAELEVSSQTLAAATNIAVRTLTRRKREGRLQPDESERLYRIGSLYDRAVEVLGDRDGARHWFKSPKRALNGEAPLTYGDTQPGAREVEDLLGRLEHGVFS